ncbi:MAG: hypothetical protein HC819_10385 [Cyclobacteriaceae bacterium]|nr:hypothetical protein [Cyclobacteriaceae bacterium]
MKKLVLTVWLVGCSFASSIYAQEIVIGQKEVQAILQGRTEPSIEQKLSPIFIINNVVIRDTVRIEKFREKYLPTVDKVEYLNKDQALDEYNIKHEDGILRIYIKRKKILDI